ncbi:MAG TPA: (2Fe-2S) ferredoxin domain-containing protein [Candidatus Polarisedimenticolia bacterium]|nr:(2Fe-2S) ferredoxin domain-containing protein [Candidatus Polarisedimenticolia bacterium]
MNLPFRQHILICTGPRCGNERNSNRVRNEFRREFVRQGLPASVKETQCICFGLCSYGPNVIVYPDGVVYSAVKPQDVAEIVREHLTRGRVVERLLYKKREAPAAAEGSGNPTGPQGEADPDNAGGPGGAPGPGGSTSPP